MTCSRIYTCAAILASSIAILSPMSAGALTPEPPSPERLTPDAKSRAIARGEYLVNSSGCHLCHTPKKMGKQGPESDMSRMLSGHPETLQMPPPPPLPEGPWVGVSAASSTAWSGPWGVSYTANITPDYDTGLGRWTLRDFVDTFRSGRRMGRGRKVLPPMPTSAYKNFSDEDLAAIYFYLQSIPAIRNRVPEPVAPAG